MVLTHDELSHLAKVAGNFVTGGGCPLSFRGSVYRADGTKIGTITTGSHGVSMTPLFEFRPADGGDDAGG